MKPSQVLQAERGADIEQCDEALMESIRKEDIGALQLLMNRHWQELVAFSSRMLGEVDEAEDVVQEVFVSVWQHRARWTLQGSVRAYLFRIARNLLLHRFRHREVRARTEIEVRNLSSSPPSPVEDAIHAEGRVAFDRALAALPERRREAFSLVRLQGMSLAEAAETMGVTRRTLTNHVYLAARELELALRPYLR